jgi:hypothetical protein
MINTPVECRAKSSTPPPPPSVHTKPFMTNNKYRLTLPSNNFGRMDSLSTSNVTLNDEGFCRVMDIEEFGTGLVSRKRDSSRL